MESTKLRNCLLALPRLNGPKYDLAIRNGFLNIDRIFLREFAPPADENSLNAVFIMEKEAKPGICSHGYVDIKWTSSPLDIQYDNHEMVVGERPSATNNNRTQAIYHKQDETKIFMLK